MRFRLEQLARFVAAGAVGSIRRAAENIHLPQPSNSNAVANLEALFRPQLHIRRHAEGMARR